jgi:hypothetical protein
MKGVFNSVDLFMASFNYLMRNPRKPKTKKNKTPILGV